MYPYHISICYINDIWRDYEWKRYISYQLWDMYQNEIFMQIPIAWMGSGGSANLCASGLLYQQLYKLWSTGHENYKCGLHVSL